MKTIYLPMAADIINSGHLNVIKKAKKYGKIAGIHNGTTNYAKEMIALGYQFVTVSSDFRAMSSYAKNIIDEMKNTKDGKESSTY